MKNLKKGLIILSLLIPFCLSPVWAENTSMVNINTAAISQLSTLNGIGAKKAQSIVDFREKHGKFNHIEDLDNVPGIGIKTIEKNRARLQVEVASEASSSEASSSEAGSSKDKKTSILDIASQKNSNQK